jgi:hypothetical protein
MPKSLTNLDSPDRNDTRGRSSTAPRVSKGGRGEEQRQPWLRAGGASSGIFARNRWLQERQGDYTAK